MSVVETVAASVTVPGETIPRVELLPVAVELLRSLWHQYGPLMFHQSGGCCDGSSPMCYPRDDLIIGDADVFLGWVDDTPFYMSVPQFEYWQHTHLTVDVVPGRGSGFSVEAPEGVRFMIRSRTFTPGETARLDQEGSPPTGRQH
jgi:uncharacterized protein (DUF779 family)